MTRIVTGLAVSADGYIAGPDDRPGQPLGVGGERLFDWYSDGDTPSQRYPSFRLSAKSAAFFDDFAGRFGSVITSGIGDAVAQARSAAGDKDVSLMGSAAVQQALHEGLLDEIVLHQIPVLLGSGVRLLNGATADLRCTRVVDAPGVTHLTYEVAH